MSARRSGGVGVLGLVVGGCVASSAGVVPAPGDPPEEGCPVEFNTLDLSRSPRGFAKSTAWSFFPGDVNGDGVDDLVVTDDRGVHFYFRPAVMTADPALDVDAILAGEGGFSIITSEGPWMYRLEPVSGDVNGDGRDDVIVWRSDTKSFVVLFSPGSTGAVDVATIGGATPGLEISSSDFLWQDITSLNPSGLRVTDVADLGGDGRGEVLVAMAVGYGDGDYFQRVWIVPGAEASASIDVATDPEVIGRDASYGRAVDLDGDGSPELAVINEDNYTSRLVVAGAPFTGPGDEVAGVFAFEVADVDGDGRDDLLYAAAEYIWEHRWGARKVLFGRSWPAVEGFDITGLAENPETSLVPLGDVNGDGRDDLLVAPSVYSPTGIRHVLYGKGDSTPVHVDRAIVGAGGYTITGSDLYGELLAGAGAGDVNGDGVGDYWLDTSREDEDRVVFGGGHAPIEDTRRCDDPASHPTGGPAEGPGSLLWTYAETASTGSYIAAYGLASVGERGLGVVGQVGVVADESVQRGGSILIRSLSDGGVGGWSSVVPNADSHSEPESERARDIVIAEDGDWVVVGVAGVAGRFKNYAWVRRLSAEGETRWTTTITDANANVEGGAWAIVGIDDGTFVVACEPASWGGLPWLTRLDGAGAVLGSSGWNPDVSPAFGGAARDLAFADGRVYAVGRQYVQNEPSRGWVGAYTRELEPLWWLDDLPRRAEALAAYEGDLIVAGVADGASYEWSARHGTDVGGEGWIRRIAGEDGTLRWHRELDHARGQRIRDLAIGPGGEIVAVGEVFAPDMRAWIARLDGDGQELWSFEASVEVDGLTQARALAVDGDRFYVGGYATDVAGYARLWVQARAL